jgi:ATP-dependent Clp protease ATP-binding subunit ClpA
MAVTESTQLVGRDEELGRVEEFLSRGGSTALLVEGEPGIGKTTLWKAARQPDPAGRDPDADSVVARRVSGPDARRDRHVHQLHR